jgi:hypothetical protein
VSGLADITVAMADQIRDALDGVDSIPIQVEPRMVLTPTPLTIDIYPGDLARDADSAAFDDVDGGYLFTVRSRINTPDFDAAYDVLIALMDDDDPLCLPLVLLDDPTLNGYATSIDVRNPTGLRLYEALDGDGGYLGWQFTALVLPAKS